MADRKLMQAVEAYFNDLRIVKASGDATNERSLYVPLANLLNAVGGTLRPKVFAFRNWPIRMPVIPTTVSMRTGRVQKRKPRVG